MASKKAAPSPESGGSPTLSRGDLNRATLARQMLLDREKATPVAAIERLAGLQAQLARPPYVGLWTRLQGFRREDLTRALHDRAVVRATLMRGTLHLFGAADYRRLRSAIQPGLDKGMKSLLKGRLDDLDLPALHREAATYFEKPRTFEELRDHLMSSRPGADDRALGLAVRYTLPLVMAPEEAHDWGYHARATFVGAETWLGKPIGRKLETEALVLRYLAAFGPATPADAQCWAGVPGLKEAFEALRPKLATFRDERGRELFDLPDAPRPPADTPAPVRFLPEYDNLMLGHDDRSRVIADEHRKLIATPNLQVLATFLVDGRAAGTWKTDCKKGVATLQVSPFAPLPKKVKDALAAEGEALLAFLEPSATRRSVSFSPRRD